jgi:hypothetical protein
MIGQHSFKYVKRNGKIIEMKNVRVTSSNFERDTLNISMPSGQHRTLKWLSLIEYDGNEITL